MSEKIKSYLLMVFNVWFFAGLVLAYLLMNTQFGGRTVSLVTGMASGILLFYVVRFYFFRLV